MSRVKLLSNLQTDSGVIEEGRVVDLPDSQSEHLINLGAAEASDAETTAAVTETPKQEVDAPADPLATTQPDGASAQPTPEAKQQQAPETPEQVTPQAPASSSTNLHLG